MGVTQTTGGGGGCPGRHTPSGHLGADLFDSLASEDFDLSSKPNHASSPPRGVLSAHGDDGHLLCSTQTCSSRQACQLWQQQDCAQVLSLDLLVASPDSRIGSCSVVPQPSCFQVLVDRCSEGLPCIAQPVRCGATPHLDLRQVQHFFKHSTAVNCNFTLCRDWSPLFEAASLSSTWDQWWMLYYLVEESPPWVSHVGPAAAQYFVDGSFFASSACAGWGFVVVWQDANGHCSFMGFAGSQFFEEDVANMQCLRLDSSYAEAVAMLAAMMHAFTQPVTDVTLHYDCSSIGESAGYLCRAPPDVVAVINVIRALVAAYRAAGGAVHFVHIKAHDASYWNDAADAIAKAVQVGQCPR